jgi:hypothetical protein
MTTNRAAIRTFVTASITRGSIRDRLPRGSAPRGHIPPEAGGV